MAVGPAYKAKVLCSIVFGTGRVIDPRHAEEVSADSYALMRLFRARVDRDRQAVSASLLGLGPRTAMFRADLGATLCRRAHSHAPSSESKPRQLRKRRHPATQPIATRGGRHHRDSSNAILPASTGRAIVVVRGETPPSATFRSGLTRDFRLVNDQERTERARRRADWRGPSLAAGPRRPARVAGARCARGHPGRGPAADAQRSEVFRRLRRPALGCHRNALQSARCRRVRGKPAAAISGRHDLELLERDHEHPVSYFPQPGRGRPLL